MAESSTSRTNMERSDFIDALSEENHTSQSASSTAASNTVVGAFTPRTIDVLLVDDQEIVCKVIQRILASELDITLRSCHRPQEALQIIIKRPPTVILLDLVMPEIDGLLLLRWLKLHSATRDIPIVMLSSEEKPELKAKAFAQGANDYLVKPPHELEFIARIRYHARSYRNFRGLLAATHLAQAQSHQLQKTLRALQTTQAQLIQTEKLAGLEQLVAGMAHEINNPINFIYGNLSHAQEYADQLLRIAQLHQQSCSLSHTELQEHPDNPDLDFIAEDLPKLLTSMKIGADRIRQIILSLRNFSHLDQSDLKAVNIHEGLESTLLILQHRFAITASHPHIQVLKDYSDLPLVECYPAQLNQVFINVLSNAIDAIEQMRQQAGESYIGQICIHTALELGDRPLVLIKIADNGCGMNESVQSRIFDPFFTTKPIGKGTGLGLSTSYQVIVSQHGGAMKCTSVPEQGTEFRIAIPLQVRKK